MKIVTTGPLWWKKQYYEYKVLGYIWFRELIEKSYYDSLPSEKQQELLKYLNENINRKSRQLISN